MVTAWAFTGLTQGLGLGIGAVALVGALVAGAWTGIGCLLGRHYDKNHGSPQ
ncbi:MAG: MFS transporter, partial [Deltaproteobacteria bacterium]|nr:MFS transporter [Deltaproteobacteria bacterium]